MELSLEAILEKYKIIISKIIGCEKDEIDFLCNEQPINNGDLKADAHWSIGYFRVVQIKNDKHETISHWKLYEMPHCCAFMISCKVHVYPSFQNKGIGSHLNKFRKDLAALLGYSAILCTDVDTNTNQRKILKKNGWKDIYTIINRRTSRTVHITLSETKL